MCKRCQLIDSGEWAEEKAIPGQEMISPLTSDDIPRRLNEKTIELRSII